ncbi:MAG: hypothetical protein FK734_01290 [Asgard group archaeon]|nr:hypothetical protein [Asgard group archaeon]
MNNRARHTIFLFAVTLLSINILAVAISQGYVTYDVIHNGYFESTKEIITWGGDQEEGSAYVDIDVEENIIMTCFSYSYDSNKTVTVIKYNKTLDKLWERSWDINDDANPVGIVTDSNKNIYVAGTVNTQFEAGKFVLDPFIIKYDENGTRLWNYTTHKIDQIDYVRAVAIDDDFNIYLTGDCNGTSGQVFIYQYDSDGIKQWEYYYGETTPYENVSPSGIEIDSQGYIYLNATTNNTVAGNFDDLVLIKLNSTGIPLWDTTFGGIGVSDNGYDVAIADDSTIYIVGQLESSVATPTDVVVLKLNSTGDILWNSTYDLAVDSGIGITVNQHNNPVIIGNSNYYDANGDIILAEFAQNGTLIWESSYQGDLVDQASDIKAYNDKLYAVGSTFNETTSSFDIIIIIYEDDYYTDFPTIGPYGRIFSYIIGITLLVFSAFIITSLLLTYGKKKK